MIGFSRATFVGRPGHRYSLPYGTVNGTATGSAVTVTAGEKTALARIDRADWDTPGKTVTIRTKKNGVVVDEGTTATGGTTVKGVSVTSASMPWMKRNLEAGDYQVEIVTDGAVRLQGEVIE